MDSSTGSSQRGPWGPVRQARRARRDDNEPDSAFSVTLTCQQSRPMGGMCGLSDDDENDADDGY